MFFYMQKVIHQTVKKVVLKSVFAQPSFYQNKILSKYLPQLNLGEVPCFHKMKILHNTVLKMNGFY